MTVPELHDAFPINFPLKRHKRVTKIMELIVLRF